MVPSILGNSLGLQETRHPFGLFLDDGDHYWQYYVDVQFHSAASMLDLTRLAWWPPLHLHNRSAARLTRSEMPWLTISRLNAFMVPQILRKATLLHKSEPLTFARSVFYNTPPIRPFFCIRILVQHFTTFQRFLFHHSLIHYPARHFRLLQLVRFIPELNDLLETSRSKNNMPCIGGLHFPTGKAIWSAFSNVARRTGRMYRISPPRLELLVL